MAVKGGGDKILGRLRLETGQLEADVKKINEVLGTIGLNKTINLNQTVIGQIRKQIEDLVAKAQQAGKQVAQGLNAQGGDKQQLADLTKAIKLATDYYLKYKQVKDSDVNSAARFKEQAMYWTQLAQSIKDANPGLAEMKRAIDAAEAAMRRLNDAEAVRKDTSKNQADKQARADEQADLNKLINLYLRLENAKKQRHRFLICRARNDRDTHNRVVWPNVDNPRPAFCKVGVFRKVPHFERKGQQTLIVQFSQAFTYLAFALRDPRRSLQIVNTVFCHNPEVQYPADLRGIESSVQSVVQMGQVVVFFRREPLHVRVQRKRRELIVPVDDISHELTADTLMISVGLAGTHDHIHRQKDVVCVLCLFGHLNSVGKKRQTLLIVLHCGIILSANSTL